MSFAPLGSILFGTRAPGLLLFSPARAHIARTIVRIAPPSPISSTGDTADGYEIVIPAKRNILILLFLTAWLGGWVMGEVSAFRELTTSAQPDWFLVFWLTGWTVGGGFAILVWLWTVAGKEVVILRPGELSIRHQLFGIGRSREFDLAHVRNLRVSPARSSQQAASMRYWGFPGTLAFDYGSRTFRFAGAVDEAEAAQIVWELRKRHSFRETAA